MDVLIERLDAKLREWKPNIVAEVRERVSEIIDLADQDALDIMRSRAVEQEMNPYPGEVSGIETTKTLKLLADCLSRRVGYNAIACCRTGSFGFT